jgi:hypothetical protein
VYVIFFEEALP